MNAQAELGKIAGAVTGSVNTIMKLGEKFSGEDGADSKMAKKARDTLSQKINAAKENKEAAAKIRAKLDIGGEE